MKSFFRLAKAGIILKNDNGFSLIEALVAMSILMVLVATVIPIDSLIRSERKTLEDKRHISFELHDKMQNIIWEDEISPSHSIEINNRVVSFEFSETAGLVQGCARWSDKNEEQKEICLFGYKER